MSFCFVDEFMVVVYEFIVVVDEFMVVVDEFIFFFKLDMCVLF